MGGDCRPLEEREGKICKAATIPTSSRAGTHLILIYHVLYHSTTPPANSWQHAVRRWKNHSRSSASSRVNGNRGSSKQSWRSIKLTWLSLPLVVPSRTLPLWILQSHCQVIAHYRQVIEIVDIWSPSDTRRRRERERDVAAHTHSRADYCSLCILQWLSSLDCVPRICTCSACVCSLPSLSLCAVVATLSPTPP